MTGLWMDWEKQRAVLLSPQIVRILNLELVVLLLLRVLIQRSLN